MPFLGFQHLKEITKRRICSFVVFYTFFYYKQSFNHKTSIISTIVFVFLGFCCVFDDVSRKSLLQLGGKFIMYNPDLCKSHSNKANERAMGKVVLAKYA